MIQISNTWAGILIGGVIVLAPLLWNMLSKKETLVHEFRAFDEPSHELVKEPQIQEKIRQIGLIEKDEFEPVLSAAYRSCDALLEYH